MMEFRSFKTFTYHLLGLCPNCGSTDIVWSAREHAASKYLFNLRVISAQCNKCLFPFKTMRIKSSVSLRPRISIDHSCPRCHRKRIYRSMRQTIVEKLASYLMINPYRCANCYHRFHVLASISQLSGLSRKLLLLSLIIVVITGSPHLLHSFKSSKQKDTTRFSVTSPKKTIIEIKLDNSIESQTEFSIKNQQTKRQALDQQVRNFIQSWKASWEKSAGRDGNIETYLAHYSKYFKTDGKSWENWALTKAAINKNKQWINIALPNIALEHFPGEQTRVNVSLFQEYNSSNYSDKSLKTLVLARETSGWKIIEEKNLY